MTSRKNQQAARQYMQTHDVSYMEALRRVTSSTSTPKAAVPGVVPRPLGEALTLGYMPPLEPEPVKPTLLDRIRGRRPGPGTPDAPTPYLLENADGPSLLTVYGRPGAGKTVLLRSILEQYRGYAAYVVHGGDLIQGGDAHDDLGVEPWEGLTEINLRPWVMGMTDVAGEVPEPPSFGDLPNGALIVLDLSNVRVALNETASFYRTQARLKLKPWFEFEASLGRMARSKSLTVASSVATENPGEMSLPLSIFGSPLGEASIKVRSLKGTDRGIRSGSSWWAYEAVGPERHLDTEDFALTQEEASRFTRPRVSGDEVERVIA